MSNPQPAVLRFLMSPAAWLIAIAIGAILFSRADGTFKWAGLFLAAIAAGAFLVHLHLKAVERRAEERRLERIRRAGL